MFLSPSGTPYAPEQSLYYKSTPAPMMPLAYHMASLGGLPMSYPSPYAMSHPAALQQYHKQLLDGTTLAANLSQSMLHSAQAAYMLPQWQWQALAPPPCTESPLCTCTKCVMRNSLLSLPQAPQQQQQQQLGQSSSSLSRSSVTSSQTSSAFAPRARNPAKKRPHSAQQQQSGEDDDSQLSEPSPSNSTQAVTQNSPAATNNTQQRTHSPQEQDEPQNGATTTPVSPPRSTLAMPSLSTTPTTKVYKAMVTANGTTVRVSMPQGGRPVPADADLVPCPYCDKKLSRRSSMKIHMRVHTGEQPFACTVAGCTKRFSQRSNCLRHVRQHEQELVGVLTAMGSSPKRQRISGPVTTTTTTAAVNTTLPTATATTASQQ